MTMTTKTAAICAAAMLCMAGAARAAAQEFQVETSTSVSSETPVPVQAPAYAPAYAGPAAYADPGYGTYAGRPGLSQSTATSLAYPPRGVTYPPIDAYGASGDPGPNYVLPPREVSVSVRPLIYNGYASTEYPQDVAPPPRQAVAYGSYETTRVVRRRHRICSTRRGYHPMHAYRHAAYRDVAVGGDRDDLPAPTRLVKRCVSNDWGRVDCNTSAY